MSRSTKRIVALAVSMVLLFVSQAMTQTEVLGLFQLGQSTYDEVKTKLPKEVQIVRDDATPIRFYGGRLLTTYGSGYSLDGLQLVNYCFDDNQTLVAVGLKFETRRYNDIKKLLISKYRGSYTKYPDSVLVFKSNHDFIQIFHPDVSLFSRGGILTRDNYFFVEYMTEAVSRKQSFTLQYVDPLVRNMQRIKSQPKRPADWGKL